MNSITQGRSNKITYIGDFDQLTWLVDMDLFRHKFYECEIPWEKRPEVRSWILNDLNGEVLIWNGCLTPDPGANGNWGTMVAPHLSKCFLIFMDDKDEVMFNLKMVGSASGLCTAVHPNGLAAYHSRKSK